MKRSLLSCALALVIVGARAHAAQAAEPRAEVAAAMSAMGGAAKLDGIERIAYRAVGTRMMVEQSERPSGPYFIDHFEISEQRDLQNRRTRFELREGAYAADQWWLDQRDPQVTTVVINDDVAALVNGTKASYAGGYYVQSNEEQFAFAPERVLQTAAAASDLRALSDVTLHGIAHHRLAFTWNGAPCVLTLNARTHLPWSIAWTRPYPYNVFLNPWGDVASTLTYNAWTLEPYGVRYPREWTYERLGLPDTQFAIVSLQINPVLDAAAMSVPSDLYGAHHGKLARVADVPLGARGSGPAHEIVPGVLQIPGGWNMEFVRQPDGIVAIEAPWSPQYTKRAFDAARAHYGLPIKAVITTSDSWPHIAGVREAAAEGIPIYALDLNRPILERMLAAPHRMSPDALSEHPGTADIRIVSEPLTIGAGEEALTIVPYRSATGERQMMVYFPLHKLLYTSDLFAPDGNGGWFTPEYVGEMLDAVASNHLAVNTVFGMHYDPTPFTTLTDYERRFATP